MPIPAIALVFLLAAGCASIHLSETSRKGAASGSLFIRILVAATAEDAHMGRAPYTSYTRTGSRPVEEARLEADLRTVNDPTPIWSAATEAFSRTDLPRATRDFADRVVRELRHQRLIAAYLRSM